MKIKKFFLLIVNNIKIFLPFLAGIFLLISIGKQFIPEDFAIEILKSSDMFQALFANILGSMFFTNAAQSYILGGEFLKGGVSLLAVTSFMVSWVTVGLVHLPLEIQFLGKKFAIYRNIISFFLSFCVAGLTVLLYSYL